MSDEQQDPREAARLSAAALRAVLAPGAEKPKVASKTFADARPRYWHIYTFKDLPGVTRTNAGSQRSDKVTITYQHKLLPGWDYLGRELPEMIQDLENLAAGMGPPTTATR